jgi:hypothetical protein
MKFDVRALIALAVVSKGNMDAMTNILFLMSMVEEDLHPYTRALGFKHQHMSLINYYSWFPLTPSEIDSIKSSVVMAVLFIRERIEATHPKFIKHSSDHGLKRIICRNYVQSQILTLMFSHTPQVGPKRLKASPTLGDALSVVKGFLGLAQDHHLPTLHRFMTARCQDISFDNVCKSGKRVIVF